MYIAFDYVFIIYLITFGYKDCTYFSELLDMIFFSYDFLLEIKTYFLNNICTYLYIQIR